MTISERLENQNKRLNTLFRIEMGVGHYIEDDTKYTRDEFNKMYPVPWIANNKTDSNTDPTKRHLYE